MKYLLPILVGFTILLGGGALVASAQGYVPLVTLPGVTEDGVAVELGDYLAGMMKFIVALAGVLAIILAIIGGVQYVAAGISPSQKDDAKKRITNAFIGLTLVLVSYLILNSINPNLVAFNLTLPKVTAPINPSTITLYEMDDGWGRTGIADEPYNTNCTLLPGPPGVREYDCSIQEARCRTAGGTPTLSSAGGNVICTSARVAQANDIIACDESSLATINFLGGSVTVNNQFTASLQRINDEWIGQGVNRYRVTSWGSYNCRGTASGGQSYHAYGAAIDINPLQNPHCPRDPQCGGKNILITNMPEEFRRLFLNEGWGWGGNWNSSKDAMHFSKGIGEGGDMRGN